MPSIILCVDMFLLIHEKCVFLFNLNQLKAIHHFDLKRGCVLRDSGWHMKHFTCTDRSKVFTLNVKLNQLARVSKGFDRKIVEGKKFSRFILKLFNIYLKIGEEFLTETVKIANFS